MSKKLKVKVEGAIEDIVNNIESVVNSLKEGKLVLERNGEFIALEPQNPIYMEISAEDKKDKEKISLSFSWRKEIEEEKEEAVQFSISSKEPEMATEVEEEEPEEEDEE